jgi:hypothetical protein
LTSLPDKEAFLEYCRAKAHTWATNADTFLLSVDINDLKARPKNTEDLKSSAAQRIRSMETQPEDARSAIYKDKNGISLACVLAWRVPECPKLTDVGILPLNKISMLKFSTIYTDGLPWGPGKDSD